MKKHILLIVLYTLAVSFAKAQTTGYKVVFDMSSKDTVNQQAVIRELGLIRQSSPEAQMEVVIYGQGLSLVLKDGSAQEAAVQQLAADKNIVFKVCAITMKRNNVDKSRLLPGVQVVPDGIYEIVSKQQQGWGYIKVAH
ncbi:MAG TPA: DsrE family protein [Chitinophagaceae bacterium]|nr:DsrE family protein [Chitinophagaceae bacterium]